MLTVNEISNLFIGAIASGTQSADDQYDDNDPDTDQALSLVGLFVWSIPWFNRCRLSNGDFDIAEGAPGVTGLNLVRTARRPVIPLMVSHKIWLFHLVRLVTIILVQGSQAPAESVIVVPEVQANTQHVYVSETPV